MLPFLKKREASASMPVDAIEITADDPVDMLAAVAADMMTAFKQGDEKLLKDALAAFAEHLLDMDQQQDQTEGQ